jgi:hypothetical protein
MRRRGRALVAVAACLAALTVAACGRNDFNNEPRPPLPAEISVQVSDDTMTVSPPEFGAGIANFTILNLSDAPTGVAIDGPVRGESDEIAPNTTAVLKLDLDQGDYRASASDTNAEFRFRVGAERPSANNDLLTP